VRLFLRQNRPVDPDRLTVRIQRLRDEAWKLAAQSRLASYSAGIPIRRF